MRETAELAIRHTPFEEEMGGEVKKWEEGRIE